MQSSQASVARSVVHSLLHFSSTVAITIALLLSFTLVGTVHAQVTLASFEDPAIAQQDVFYRGVDQHVYFKYWSQGAWQVQDTTKLSGAPTTAPVSAITSFKDNATNQQHIFFEGTNQHIYDLASPSNPSSWAYTDLTALTGGAVAASSSALASFYDNSYGVRFVFYIGANQHINLLYWYGSWATQDLTATSGAPLAAVGSALSGARDEQGNLDHLYYEGADQHIHELYTADNPYLIQIKDDSGSAGATIAELGTPLTSFFDASSRTEHVFYIGIDQHVHHLTFTTIWQAEDVTALAPALTPALGGFLTSFQDYVTNQRHVFYVGVDQHLHQFFTSGSTWYAEDITFDSGAPLPAATSPLTSFKDDPNGQQHLFYIGADLHFYQVFYQNHWYSQDLAATVQPAL